MEPTTRSYVGHDILVSQDMSSSHGIVPARMGLPVLASLGSISGA